MADDKIFDSVFKTIVAKMPRLLVPFVNEAFGRDYPADAEVVPYGVEHETPAGARIADSVFRLGGRLYHAECQSTADGAMALRMIEYDFAIALDEAVRAGAPYEMTLPESCVLFLRHTASTPDRLTVRVNLPGGGSFDYGTRVVKAQEFTGDEIFEKRLLLLLPFYLMRYEEDLGEIAADDGRTEALLSELSGLRVRLEAATLAQGETLLYGRLTELIIEVADRLLAADEALRGKVRRTMGGEVLEFADERAERLGREGEERGLKQGIEQGIEGIASRLREQGVDESLLQAAIAEVRAEEDSR